MIATQTQNVIIDSIGGATPAVSTILSEAFGIPKEVFLKLLYNTPSVMFNGVAPSLAEQAKELLTTLGLEVSILDSTTPLPTTPELVDIGVYVSNPLMLPKVTAQLAEFLGCERHEALTQLMAEPAIVLGGVSASTAAALSRRLDAEIIYSNPKKDLYTLNFITKDQNLIKQVFEILKMKPDTKNPTAIQDLNYEKCQELWRKFPVEGNFQFVNQSFARYEITFESADENKAQEYTKILAEEIGIPTEIIPTILVNLPIQLHESVSKTELHERLLQYQEAGMKCGFRELPYGKFIISVSEFSDRKKAREILKQFIPEKDLPKAQTTWESKTPFSHLLTRYAVAQLESIGCVAEIREV